MASLSAVSSSSGKLSSTEKRDKFKVDKRYFLSCICDELRKGDKYRRGLVTAETFSKVLNVLDLEYGSEEIDLLLKYCIVTDDGYVYYKDLLTEMLPLYKGQNARDNVAEAMNPTEQTKLDSFDASKFYSSYKDNASRFCEYQLLTPQKSEHLRKLYAQWDKCNLKDHELKHYLRVMGFPISFEFERLLTTYGPSRTLSFGDLVQALEIDNICTHRKARKLPFQMHHTEACSEVPLNNRSYRDVISWREMNLPKTRHYSYGQSISDDSEASPDATEPGCISLRETNRRVAAAVGRFLECSSNGPYFMIQLQRLGIKIDTPLSNLIRSHEADNRGKFSDFMRVIHMQLENNPAFVPLQEMSEIAKQTIASHAPHKDEHGKHVDALAAKFERSHILETLPKCGKQSIDAEVVTSQTSTYDGRREQAIANSPGKCEASVERPTSFQIETGGTSTGQCQSEASSKRPPIEVNLCSCHKHQTDVSGRRVRFRD